MKDIGPVSASQIDSYHAHVYFDTNDAVQMTKANHLHAWIAERFSVEMGSLGTKAGGPHPLPMFQVAFNTILFAQFVPWLMMNHEGLSVLIHPNTDNMLADHLVNPLWLGAQLQLRNSEMLPSSLQAIGHGQPPIVINTSPTETV